MHFSATGGVEQYDALRMSTVEIETLLTAGNIFVLFEGGADIDPALYGETNTYHNSYCDRRRDAHEIMLWRMARRLNVPMLGICRGHQFMAAMAGGTLYQDLHKQRGRGHSGVHKIQLTAVAEQVGFAQLMESNPLGSPDKLECIVNSMHHQAVRDIPNDARVLATAYDGVNEALVYPYGVSVQWHPEFLDHTDFIAYMQRFMHDQPEDTNRGGDRSS